MNYFDILKEKIAKLDEKQFYTYVATGLGILTVFILMVIFYYYRSSNFYKKQLKELNNTRASSVRQLLATAERIKIQKEKLDKIIEEDPDFILADYLENKVLSKLRLNEKKDFQAPPKTNDIDEKYREHILEFTLNDINMKQLVDLLAEIETNKRVYTKKLEITKSKTTPNSLEATITVATLFFKAK